MIEEQDAEHDQRPREPAPLAGRGGERGGLRGREPSGSRRPTGASRLIDDPARPAGLPVGAVHERDGVLEQLRASAARAGRAGRDGRRRCRWSRHRDAADPRARPVVEPRDDVGVDRQVGDDHAACRRPSGTAARITRRASAPARVRRHGTTPRKPARERDPRGHARRRPARAATDRAATIGAAARAGSTRHDGQRQLRILRRRGSRTLRSMAACGGRRSAADLDRRRLGNLLHVVRRGRRSPRGTCSAATFDVEHDAATPARRRTTSTTGTSPRNTYDRISLRRTRQRSRRRLRAIARPTSQRARHDQRERDDLAEDLERAAAARRSAARGRARARARPTAGTAGPAACAADSAGAEAASCHQRLPAPTNWWGPSVRWSNVPRGSQGLVNCKSNHNRLS